MIELIKFKEDIRFNNLTNYINKIDIWRLNHRF